MRSRSGSSAGAWSWCPPGTTRRYVHDIYWEVTKSLSRPPPLALGSLWLKEESSPLRRWASWPCRSHLCRGVGKASVCESAEELATSPPSGGEGAEDETTLPRTAGPQRYLRVRHAWIRPSPSAPAGR